MFHYTCYPRHDLLAFSNGLPSSRKSYHWWQVGITAAESPIAMWQSNLSGGARRIFDFLVAEYPTAFTRQHIGDQAGLSAKGGTFTKYLGILRNNGLIEVQGNEITAAKTLFL